MTYTSLVKTAKSIGVLSGSRKRKDLIQKILAQEEASQDIDFEFSSEPEAGSESEQDQATEPETEPVTHQEPKPQVCPEPEVESDPVTQPEQHTAPEPYVQPEPEPEPEPALEPEPEPEAKLDRQAQLDREPLSESDTLSSVDVLSIDEAEPFEHLDSEQKELEGIINESLNQFVEEIEEEANRTLVVDNHFQYRGEEYVAKRVFKDIWGSNLYECSKSIRPYSTRFEIVHEDNLRQYMTNH